MEQDDRVEECCYEIEYPSSKKDELIELLKGNDISIFTHIDKEYEYLEEDDLVIVIHNQDTDKYDMEIILDNEFTLVFAGWHAHYMSYEHEYVEMKEDIVDILSGKIGIFTLSTNNRWLGSCFYNGEELSHRTNEKKLLRSNWNHKDTIKEVLTNGGNIDIIFWRLNDSFRFEIRKDGKGKRKYPCRGNVRFVLDEGRDIGSGGFKKYNDEIAYLHYLHIETEESGIYEELFEKIQSDIIRAGYKKIITLVGINKKVFYENQGFIVSTDKFDMDKINDLSGAIIDYTFVMEKSLVV